MRRLLSEPVKYVRDLVLSAVRAWSKFFFTPADPTPIGLIRVAVGALLFWDVVVLGLDLQDYLGSEGWIGPEAVRQYLAEHAPWAWSFWLWVPDRWLPVAWVGCLVIAALFTVGLGSRVTAILAWMVAVSIVRRAPVALFGFDHIISTWMLYLAAFGASGQAVSLDRFLSRYRILRRWRFVSRRDSSLADSGPSGVPAATISANLSQRMIQLHLVLIYGSAGLSKLMGPEWWNGTAMEMVMLTPEFRRFDLTWLAAFPALLNLMTHGGVLLEIGYPVLIWVRKLRPLLILSAALMHFGIDLMLGLTEFGLAMVAANLAFVSGPWLRGLVTGDQQPAGHLLFDPHSRRGRALATFILAADPDGIIRLAGASVTPAADLLPDPLPEDCRQSLHLVCADGRSTSGLDAFVIVAGWLPLLWPVGLLMRVPGIRSVLRTLSRSGLMRVPSVGHFTAGNWDGNLRSDSKPAPNRDALRVR